MIRLAMTVAVAFAASAAIAAPTLDPMFGDHAVVQRDAPVHVRGLAAPGEQVTVTFAGRTHRARADMRGGWEAEFAALPAGGPYRIEVRGADTSVDAADDVMVGDVWLCSGQSNMEWPLVKALNGEGEVAGASDLLLRLMKVPQNRALGSQALLAASVEWNPTTPQSAANFSAACYFMARRLREAHGVAIGAIDSTWGGTAIHSWMDEVGVRSTGGAADVDLLRQYRSEPERTVRDYGNRWTSWWRERSGDARGTEPWRASDRLAWQPVPKIGVWEEWGDPALFDYNGAIWARVRFTLAPDQAAEDATLSLGAIDDFDRTFVNGEAVGQTFMYDRPRNYSVRQGLLKPGVNEVVVYVLDIGGGGGFWSPPEELKLTLSSGGEVPLATGWEFSLVPAGVGPPPLPPWDNAPGVTTLYNGMIAPLGPVRLKGVAWYQGEADVGKDDYDQRLLAMMQGWRRQFGDSRLPFLIVGLAGFGQPVSQPRASSWAALIDDQRKAAAADPHAALVSAIDIGERDDIHPPNKQEVGRRLALAAETLAYGGKGALQPEPVEAMRTSGTLVVHFDKPVETYSYDAALGFELCGQTQESCRYARARAKGSTVVIADDGQPSTRVRYAWADYPIVNLYGPERLPVPPFEITIGR